METREFVYETTFPEKTITDKAFVEDLWARRKVGYLLDQIRANGPKKELVDETVALAKRYGIATPYTSYLIVPDGPVPVARGGAHGPGGRPDVRFNPYGASYVPPGLADPTSSAAKPQKVADFARQAQAKPGELEKSRGRFEEGYLLKEAGDNGKAKGERQSLKDALELKKAYDDANRALGRRDREGVQTGKLGVDLSVQSNNLRAQCRLSRCAQQQANGRSCLEIGGVWIDEGFDAKMPTLTVKAMSDAYFRILERHKKMKDVFQMGNHLVWVAPNGTALVIDTSDGKEKLTDDEIDQLFVARK
jgi:Ca-activated chloride channel family protein